MPLVALNRESEEQELPFCTTVALMRSMVQPAVLVLLRFSQLPALLELSSTQTLI